MVKHHKQLLSIGIRREAKNRWERRVPLMPKQVKALTDMGVNVYVQPSLKRIVPDEKYHEVGAIISDDLTAADVILGVKEVPINELIDGKTYLFFSHTHKGQISNMPLLEAMLQRRIRMIDYELMTDDHGKRVVHFGRFAGHAGFMDGLHAFGQRLLGLGSNNPFLPIGMSYMYRDLKSARLDLKRTGEIIKRDGLPKDLTSMVTVFTGGGNVAQGAVDFFKHLPHRWISPNDLKNLKPERNLVYGCWVKPSDFLLNRQGMPFDRDHYRNNPECYESVFHKNIAPHVTMLVNGIYWDDRYPRLLTKQQIAELSSKNGKSITTIADISCDVKGSLEFMEKISTIDAPFYMYDPITDKCHDDLTGRGVQIMSIDNLPAEFALEASEHFGRSLIPFVTDLVKGKPNSTLTRAAITTPEGSLVEERRELEKHFASTSMMTRQPQSHRKKPHARVRFCH